MFWNVFVKLCLEKGEKPNPVAKKLGIASSAVTNWKNGGVPHYTNLQRIAEYFNVTVDFLTSSNQEEQQITLSEQEKRLVLAYRSKPQMQVAVDKLLDIGFSTDAK